MVILPRHRGTVEVETGALVEDGVVLLILVVFDDERGKFFVELLVELVGAAFGLFAELVHLYACRLLGLVELLLVSAERCLAEVAVVLGFLLDGCGLVLEVVLVLAAAAGQVALYLGYLAAACLDEFAVFGNGVDVDVADIAGSLVTIAEVGYGWAGLKTEKGCRRYLLRNRDVPA